MGRTNPGKEQRARGRIKVSKQTSLVSGVKHHSDSTLPSTGVIAKVSTLAARVKAQQLVPRGWLDPQRLSGLRRGTHARRALSARGERKSQVAGDDRVPLLDHGQGISPRCPVGSRPPSLGRSQAHPAPRQG